jgi:hypothetical protein
MDAKQPGTSGGQLLPLFTEVLFPFLDLYKHHLLMIRNLEGAEDLFKYDLPKSCSRIHTKVLSKTKKGVSITGDAYS